MATGRARGKIWLVALPAAGVLLVVVAVGRAWTDVQRESSGLVMTSSSANSSAFPIPDLATLTRMSDLVVVGRVTTDGTTQVLVQPAQTPIPFQPVAPPTGLSPEKAAELASNTPPPRTTSGSQGQTAASGPKIPITEFPVQIERVARGGTPVNSQVTVLQTGGVLSAPVVPGGPSVSRAMEIEGDALMRAGERYILFLQRTPDGRFAMVGGPQGRLRVDATARVHPLAPGAPATRGRDGQTVDAFLADIAAL